MENLEVTEEMLAEVEMAAATLRLDSAETAFFARELEVLKSRTFDIKYPSLKARQYIPVSHDASPADETITYQQWDAQGMAVVVSHWAQDVPKVELAGKEFTTKIKEIAIDFGYSLAEMRKSAAVGRSLPDRKASKAREFIERGIDEVGAFGIPEASMPGFVNHPNIPIVVLPTGDWATATAEEILADLNYMVSQIIVNSKQTEEPDSVLLPTDLFLIVSQKVAGSDLKDTILGIFLKTNPYIRRVESWVKLDAANAAGTDGRIICYKRDPNVLELEIAGEFEMGAPIAEKRGFSVGCSAWVGGVVVYYPLAICFADNA